MKTTIMYALVWISVAFAISVAIITLKTAAPLWGFLIPACISVESSKCKDEAEENE